MNFNNIVEKFQKDELTFDELLEQVSGLEWAEKDVAPDGSVDWVGENQSVNIDNYVLDGVFTPEQRKAIFQAIGN